MSIHKICLPNLINVSYMGEQLSYSLYIKKITNELKKIGFQISKNKPYFLSSISQSNLFNLKYMKHTNQKYLKIFSNPFRYF